MNGLWIVIPALWTVLFGVLFGFALRGDKATDKDLFSLVAVRIVP